MVIGLPVQAVKEMIKYKEKHNSANLYTSWESNGVEGFDINPDSEDFVKEYIDELTAYGITGVYEIVKFIIKERNGDGRKR